MFSWLEKHPDPTEGFKIRSNLADTKVKEKEGGVKTSE